MNKYKRHKIITLGNQMLSKNVLTFVFLSTKKGKKKIKKKFPVSDTHNRQMYLLTMKMQTVNTRVFKGKSF